jgi:hypothetical protein
MKKVILTLMLATFASAYIYSAGANLLRIGSPGWGTGSNIIWSSIISFEDNQFVSRGWTYGRWGNKIEFKHKTPMNKISNGLEQKYAK